MQPKLQLPVDFSDRRLPLAVRSDCPQETQASNYMASTVAHAQPRSYGRDQLAAFCRRELVSHVHKWHIYRPDSQAVVHSPQEICRTYVSFASHGDGPCCCDSGRWLLLSICRDDQHAIAWNWHDACPDCLPVSRVASCLRTVCSCAGVHLASGCQFQTRNSASFHCTRYRAYSCDKLAVRFQCTCKLTLLIGVRKQAVAECANHGPNLIKST